MRSNKIIKFIQGAFGGAFEALVNTDPRLAIPWNAIKGGVNAVRTQRAEDFIVFIENNITLNQLKTPQTMDVIALSFEQFIKQRNEEKREIIKKIFLDFNKNIKKENFEIERIYQIIETISINSIKFLSFINKNIIQKLEKNNSKEISKYFSDFISQDNNKIKYETFIKSSKEIFAELIGLGIVRMSGYAFISDPNNGQDNVYYSLTDFGINFIHFLNDN